jgi:hypothetical protein
MWSEAKVFKARSIFRIHEQARTRTHALSPVSDTRLALEQPRTAEVPLIETKGILKSKLVWWIAYHEGGQQAHLHCDSCCHQAQLRFDHAVARSLNQHLHLLLLMT